MVLSSGKVYFLIAQPNPVLGKVYYQVVGMEGSFYRPILKFGAAQDSLDPGY
ncbi:unnamed protein product [marine sediment metagenome]|uniref:Uncharacterized protein n=1 Tax=marine sediment metagenome TaxID=412755 RepID=X1KQP0_9ZZZZ